MRVLPLLGATVIAAAAAAAAACGDPLGLPKPSFANRLDSTVSLYALSGTAVTLPSGYVIAFRQRIRTDQVAEFDFAFDIDTAGRALLLPTGALRLPRGSGLQLTTTPFDSIKVAPTRNYQLDSAVAVSAGSVVIVHSRLLPCSFGGTFRAPLYAKLFVLAIDATPGPNGRRIDFRILTNINCGYRGLEEGLPKR